MKTIEAIRKLSAKGCYLEENRTNHEWWYSPITGLHFPVPRHKSKELPQGTKNNISKASGVKL
jgi:predicted RNA binding protein YcfA (HicA-like mRNA interferase family)